MARILITQSILWAAAIIAVALVPPESAWLLLAVLASVALGALKNGIESVQPDRLQ